MKRAELRWVDARRIFELANLARFRAKPFRCGVGYSALTGDRPWRPGVFDLARVFLPGPILTVPLPFRARAAPLRPCSNLVVIAPGGCCAGCCARAPTLVQPSVPEHSRQVIPHELAHR